MNPIIVEGLYCKKLWSDVDLFVFVRVLVKKNIYGILLELLYVNSS